jgi:hypothetical protein
MAKSGADMYLLGYHQIPSGVENPDQVKYGKMDFSDRHAQFRISQLPDISESPKSEIIA